MTVYLNGKDPNEVNQPRVQTLKTSPPTVLAGNENKDQVTYVPQALFIGYATEGLFEAEYVVYDASNVELFRTLVCKANMQTWPGTN